MLSTAAAVLNIISGTMNRYFHAAKCNDLTL